MSDGSVHLLLLLTILFAENPEQGSLIILDEPEIALHPWALVILGEAMHLAATEWNKQLLVATHSPVLISQFEPDELTAAETLVNQTRLRRLSEIDEVQELLEDYAAGALYMAGELAPQKRTSVQSAHGALNVVTGPQLGMLGR